MNTFNKLENVISIINNSEMTDTDKGYCRSVLYEVLNHWFSIEIELIDITKEINDIIERGRMMDEHES